MSIYPKLRKILSDVNNPVVIEIGAHIGTDTVKLARLLNKPYTYLAIEPDRRNYGRLKPICDDIGATLLPMAIGDTDGPTEFWLSTGFSGRREHTDSSSLKKPIPTAKRPAHIGFKKSKIICHTLDWVYFIYQLKHVDLIWMDVQGAELEVFRGAVATLMNTSYIYTECQEGRYEGQPGYDGIMEALFNWKIILKDGDNILLENVPVRI